MGKSILLINPWIYDFSAYNLWIKPLGLYYLASYLRKNGHNISIIDCLDLFLSSGPPPKNPPIKKYGDGKFYAEKIEKPTILQKMHKQYKRYGIPLSVLRKHLSSLAHVDFILITSMMTYWYPAVFEIIALAKEALPCAIVVLGGNYVTLCPIHAKGSGADFLVTGPAERSFQYLQETILGCRTDYLPDENSLDSLPYPAFEFAKRNDFIPILASRGCPFRCSYCASHILNDKFNRRSPDKVLEEIWHWYRVYGTKNFVFYDDALLFKPYELFIPLSQMLSQHERIFNFHCPNGLHAAEITANVAHLLMNAGFRTIRLGLESADNDRQIKTGGKVTNEQFQAAMAYLYEAGYSRADVGVYILCGLPGQSAHEVEETIHFVWKSGGKPMISEFSPIPQTPLWKNAVEATAYDIENEPLFHNNSLLAYQNKEFTISDLQRLKILIKTLQEN